VPDNHYHAGTGQSITAGYVGIHSPDLVNTNTIIWGNLSLQIIPYQLLGNHSRQSIISGGIPLDQFIPNISSSTERILYKHVSNLP
jgi:hypothetical protein